jgi:hypothetical protein
MPSPLKNNIVLKAGDEGIIEESLLLPMWHPLVVYPSIVLGLSFVKDDLKLQPNEIFFIQFKKASSSVAIRSNHFL